MLEDNLESKQIEAIKRNVRPAARYENAAEEAVELAHELQKMARILRGENPTPANSLKTFNKIIKEYTDLVLCMDMLSINPDNDDYVEKAHRWIKRLLSLDEE